MSAARSQPTLRRRHPPCTSHLQAQGLGGRGWQPPHPPAQPHAQGSVSAESGGCRRRKTTRGQSPGLGLQREPLHPTGGTQHPGPMDPTPGDPWNGDLSPPQTPLCEGTNCLCAAGCRCWKQGPPPGATVTSLPPRARWAPGVPAPPTQLPAGSGRGARLKGRGGHKEVPGVGTYVGTLERASGQGNAGDSPKCSPSHSTLSEGPQRRGHPKRHHPGGGPALLRPPPASRLSEALGAQPAPAFAFTTSPRSSSSSLPPARRGTQASGPASAHRRLRGVRQGRGAAGWDPRGGPAAAQSPLPRECVRGAEQGRRGSRFLQPPPPGKGRGCARSPPCCAGCGTTGAHDLGSPSRTPRRSRPRAGAGCRGDPHARTPRLLPRTTGGAHAAARHRRGVGVPRRAPTLRQDPRAGETPQTGSTGACPRPTAAPAPPAPGGAAGVPGATGGQAGPRRGGHGGSAAEGRDPGVTLAVAPARPCLSFPASHGGHAPERGRDRIPRPDGDTGSGGRIRPPRGWGAGHPAGPRGAVGTGAPATPRAPLRTKPRVRDWSPLRPAAPGTPPRCPRPNRERPNRPPPAPPRSAPGAEKIIKKNFKNSKIKRQHSYRPAGRLRGGGHGTPQSPHGHPTAQSRPGRTRCPPPAATGPRPAHGPAPRPAHGAAPRPSPHGHAAARTPPRRHATATGGPRGRGATAGGAAAPVAWRGGRGAAPCPACSSSVGGCGGRWGGARCPPPPPRGNAAPPPHAKRPDFPRKNLSPCFSLAVRGPRAPRGCGAPRPDHRTPPIARTELRPCPAGGAREGGAGKQAGGGGAVAGAAGPLGPYLRAAAALRTRCGARSGARSGGAGRGAERGAAAAAADERRWLLPPPAPPPARSAPPRPQPPPPAAAAPCTRRARPRVGTHGQRRGHPDGWHSRSGARGAGTVPVAGCVV
ncbi:collagen, type I, alpha 1a-like [Pithys albifrons albifrons]|uniref:collagen, type I, alpha 1a-like n=1 Tax=Pithys albifrons albifrons TaxID=3385563 RepID=UPI003A5CB8B2